MSFTDFKASEQYSDVFSYVDYWKDSKSMKRFENIHCIPQEVMMAKMWTETHGGLAGAGRKGAIFGIKGKGIKGYDDKEKDFDSEGYVEYNGYEYRWEAISDFCDLLNRKYVDRFEAWEMKNYDMPEWYNWLLALQIHPEISETTFSYASCGCKNATELSCYKKRKRHAEKNIQFVLKYLR